MDFFKENVAEYKIKLVKLEMVKHSPKFLQYPLMNHRITLLNHFSRRVFFKHWYITNKISTRISSTRILCKLIYYKMMKSIVRWLNETLKWYWFEKSKFREEHEANKISLPRKVTPPSITVHLKNIKHFKSTTLIKYGVKLKKDDGQRNYIRKKIIWLT